MVICSGRSSLVTFVADIKVHGSINPRLRSYEVVSERGPRSRGQTCASHSPQACQLDWLPRGSPCSVTADKRKWNFHRLLFQPMPRPRCKANEKLRDRHRYKDKIEEGRQFILVPAAFPQVEKYLLLQLPTSAQAKGFQFNSYCGLVWSALQNIKLCGFTAHAFCAAVFAVSLRDLCVRGVQLL